LVFLCVEILEILPGWVAHCLLVFFSPLENRLFFKALMIRRISFFFLAGAGLFFARDETGRNFWQTAPHGAKLGLVGFSLTLFLKS